MSTDFQQRLAEYLDRRVQWQRSPLWYGSVSPLRPRVGGFLYESRPTAEQLARELVADAEFQSLRLGTWLSTPEGELFARTVEMVAPPFYRQDAELLVEALKLAAKLQQRNERLAGGVLIGAAVVIGLSLGRGGAAAAAA
jgi:hypothetical protein